jgi:hypothetical protein
MHTSDTTAGAGCPAAKYRMLSLPPLLLSLLREERERERQTDRQTDRRNAKLRTCQLTTESLSK